MGSVPLWVVGDDGDAPPTAAGAAAGWFVGWNHGTSRVVQAVHKLEEECDAEGRDPRSVRVAIGATAVVGADRGVDGARSWPTDQARQWAAEMAEVGVTDLVLSFAPRPFGWSGVSAAETWANEVLGLSSIDDGYDGGERRRR
jgi:alkanesulfonate monooxygenase SsuD/methylene tetrahydromethanopterin reductase-like flavin-dependent oxidoreductase (luciferase family)